MTPWQGECAARRRRKIQADHAIVQTRVVTLLRWWRFWRDAWEQLRELRFMFIQGQGRTARRRAREALRAWSAWPRHKTQKDGGLWQAVRFRAKRLKADAIAEWRRRHKHRKGVLEERRLDRIRKARLARKKKK